jgi:hypothetical protein
MKLLEKQHVCYVSSTPLQKWRKITLHQREYLQRDKCVTCWKMKALRISALMLSRSKSSRTKMKYRADKIEFVGLCYTFKWYRNFELSIDVATSRSSSPPTHERYHFLRKWVLNSAIDKNSIISNSKHLVFKLESVLMCD